MSPARTTDGCLVGLVRVLDDDVLYACVWDVLVAPTWQRQGLGRALMTHVLAHTAERSLISLIATAAGERLHLDVGVNEPNGRSTAPFLRHEAPTAIPNDANP